MTNAIDPTGAFTASHGGTFINGPEKNDVFVEQDALYIIHAEPAAEGMYGVQTIFHVKAARWGRDETKLLAFQHNEQRQRLAENILQLLNAEPGKPVGPVYLHKFTSKTGNQGWELKPTKYEGDKTPITMPNQTTQAAPAPVAMPFDDDNVPF